MRRTLFASQLRWINSQYDINFKFSYILFSYIGSELVISFLRSRGRNTTTIFLGLALPLWKIFVSLLRRVRLLMFIIFFFPHASVFTSLLLLLKENVSLLVKVFGIAKPVNHRELENSFMLM